jgi:tRNA(fMet)-specific endonuclease VapC
MPANGNILLDTNLAVKFLAGDRITQKRVTEADRIIVSATVSGELYFGAERSNRRDENVRRIEEFAKHSEVIGVDIATARLYGIIKSSLRRKGTPIPDNDIWIAALAQQHAAAIATRDTHFDAIDSLEIVRW